MISDTKKEYNWRRLVPGFLISAICLAVVFWLSKPRELFQALKLADLRLVVLGVLMTVVWLVVRAQVWRELLQGKPSFDQAFFTVSEGYLLNNLLPFRLGEIARSLLMSQKIRTPFWEVFSTVVIERLLDLVMASSLLFISLFFVVGADWAWKATIGMGVLVLSGLGILYFAAIRRNALIDWFKAITLRWPKSIPVYRHTVISFPDRTGSYYPTLAFLAGNILDGFKLAVGADTIFRLFKGIFANCQPAADIFYVGRGLPGNCRAVFARFNRCV